MSRRKQGFLPEDDAPELDISSLIDVCFLLLIYFMVTATIQPRESDLGLTLPSSESSQPSSKFTPMLIEVQNDGSVIVNKEEQLDIEASATDRRRLPLLEARLESYQSGLKAAGEKPVVQIAVKEEAPQQSVIDVLNCLVGLQIEQVTFTDLGN